MQDLQSTIKSSFYTLRALRGGADGKMDKKRCKKANFYGSYGQWYYGVS